MTIEYFVQTKDTGANEADSLQPVLNGEDANQDTFQRPSENLRTRTEAIRKSVDDLGVTTASDRGLRVMCEPGAKLLWKNSKFYISSDGGEASDLDLYVVPLVSTAVGTSDPSFPGDSIRSRFHYLDSEFAPGEFQIQANNSVYAFNGGNNLFVKIFKNDRTLVTPVVTIEGGSILADLANGPITIAVEIDKDDGNSIAQVVAALVASVPALVFIDNTETKYLANETNAVIEVPRQAFYYRQVGDMAGGMSALDPVGVRLTSGEINTFFAAHTLVEGDVLVFNVGSAAARGACLLTLDVSSTLQIINGTIDGCTELLAQNQAVPLCKVLNGYLYFLNGQVFEDSVPHYLMQSRRDMADLAKQTTTSGDALVGANAKTSTYISLAQGTVNSQLSTLKDLGAMTAGLGGAMIGSEALTDDRFSLSAGTLRAQLTGVMTQLAKKTLAPGYTGGGVIGVAAHAARLSAGYVEDQLIELSDDMDGHVSNSSAAEKHTIKNIDGRPFVTVSATANEGDYTTISAAIVALASTGGTIFVKAGSYGAITLAADIAQPVEVIGESAGETNGVVITAAGASRLLYINIGAGISERLTFRNVCFSQTSATGANYAIECNVARNGVKGAVFFDRCTFWNSVAVTKAYIHTAIPMTFDRCYFKGKAYNNTKSAIEMLAAAGSPSTCDVHISNSIFSSWRQLVLVDPDDVGEDEVGSLVFENNKIYNCGYYVAPTDYEALLSCAADKLIFATVQNNYLPLGGADPNTALFCRLAGRGAITNNYILNRPQHVADDNALASIVVVGYGAVSGQDTFLVMGNVIDPGETGGILSLGNTRIIGNHIAPFHSSDTGARAIFVVGNNVYVKGNHIECVALDPGVDIIFVGPIGAPLENVTISENTIVGIGGSTNGRAIYTINTHRLVIANNVINLSAGKYGIFVDSLTDNLYGISVIGNILNGVNVGISVSAVTGTPAYQVLITGNSLTMRAASAKAIDLAYVDLGTVTGNVIYGSNNTGDTGLTMDHCSYISIMSNSFWNCAGAEITDTTGTNNGAGPLPVWPGSGTEYNIACFNNIT